MTAQSLMTSPVPSEQVKLTWAHGSDMNGYLLQRSTTASFTQINATYTVPANYSAYTDSVPAGVTYYYRILAYNPKGASAAAVTSTNAATTGGISGSVINDLNANGRKDANESGLAGWRVSLEHADGSPVSGVADVLTGTDGSYAFMALAVGSYIVKESIPAGWRATSPLNGQTAVSVTAATVAVAPSLLNIGPATLTGSVFNDVDFNGIQSLKDIPLSGWKVYMDVSNAGHFLATDPYVVTGANGNYSFTNLVAGTYHIREVIPAGWRTSVANGGAYGLTLAAGTTRNAAFANTNNALISGTVFHDLNANGVQNTGEAGLPGWHVTLFEEINGIWQSIGTTTLASSSGAYHFNVAAGTYRVTTTPQSGLRPTLPIGGTTTATVAAAQITVKNFGEK